MGMAQMVMAGLVVAQAVVVPVEATLVTGLAVTKVVVA